MSRVILLFGPTASGKTALALNIAQDVNGVIINADSRQLYKHMPILTAVPTPEEQAQAPHELYEILDLTTDCSAGDYVKRAQPIIEQTLKNNQTPILVGGTGFYLDVLQHGLAAVPEVDPTLRQQLQLRLKEEGAETLYLELIDRDETWAEQIDTSDTQRILRGLEVILGTGKPFSYWHQQPKTGGLNYDFFRIALNPPREVVKERIRLRCDQMLTDGLLNEIQALQDKHCPPDASGQILPGLRAHGAKLWRDHLNGQLTYDEAKTHYLTQQFQYSKRQAAFIRHHFHPHRTLTSAADYSPQILPSALQF